MFPKIGGKPPKSSILIGCSIIFTIHFGGFGNHPYFWFNTKSSCLLVDSEAWPGRHGGLRSIDRVRHAEFQHLGFGFGRGRHGTTGLHWRLGYGATDARRKIAAVQCGGNFPWSMLKRCLKVCFVFLFSSFQLWSMLCFFVFCYLAITRCLEICIQDFRSRFAATARSSTTMETHLSTPSPCNSRQGWGN